MTSKIDPEDCGQTEADFETEAALLRLRNLIQHIRSKPILAQQLLRDPENIPGSRDD
ncbi:MAG: hypothetical protein ABIH35_03015 [Patescibacteria group bacterium]